MVCYRNKSRLGGFKAHYKCNATLFLGEIMKCYKYGEKLACKINAAGRMHSRTDNSLYMVH